MKTIPIALLVIGLLANSVHGEEKRRIVLHAVKIVKVDAYRALILEDDYGFVVLNDGTEESPRPRYILGSEREGKVIYYTDKKEVLAAIAEIPEGAPPVAGGRHSTLNDVVCDNGVIDFKRKTFDNDGNM